MFRVQPREDVERDQVQGDDLDAAGVDAAVLVQDPHHRRGGAEHLLRHRKRLRYERLSFVII